LTKNSLNDVKSIAPTQMFENDIQEAYTQRTKNQETTLKAKSDKIDKSKFSKENQFVDQENIC